MTKTEPSVSNNGCQNILLAQFVAVLHISVTVAHVPDLEDVGVGDVVGLFVAYEKWKVNTIKHDIFPIILSYQEHTIAIKLNVYIPVAGVAKIWRAGNFGVEQIP
jgi:hypothetical protein